MNEKSLRGPIVALWATDIPILKIVFPVAVFNVSAVKAPRAKIKISLDTRLLLIMKFTTLIMGSGIKVLRTESARGRVYYRNRRHSLITFRGR